MIALARDYRSRPSRAPRTRPGRARLLLAQSSDWAFIMKTGTMVDYAIRRTKEHVLRFSRLHDQPSRASRSGLARPQAKHNLFPEIDYRLYAPR